MRQHAAVTLLPAARRLRTSAPAVLVAALLVVGLSPGAGPAAAAPAVRAVPVVATGAVTTAGFAIARDGRVFYGGPRNGTVYVWSPTTRSSTVFARVPQGVKVLGMTLSPSATTTPYLYVFATVGTAQGNRLQLLRYTASGAAGRGLRLLRDIAPEGTEHSGGKVTFSPDGRSLLVVVGDGGDPALAQDPASEHGKLLRLTPTGAPAPGNPSGTAVYASGLRNSIGLAFDPRNGRLWETENGPECGDELNLIRAGRNYGWGPRATCAPGTPRGTNQDGPSPVMPKAWYATPAAPTGATFCAGCGLTGAEGALLYGRYLNNDIRKVTLNATRNRVATETTLFRHDQPVLAVETDPRDGSVWFSDFTGIRRLTN